MIHAIRMKAARRTAVAMAFAAASLTTVVLAGEFKGRNEPDPDAAVTAHLARGEPGEDHAPGAAAAPQRRVSRRILLVGIDSIGDPALTPESAADSPAESSGPFDASRGDLGEDDNLANQEAAGRRQLPLGTPPAADPLRGTPRIDPATTGADAERALATMLPPRTDSPLDWQAPLEPLHWCGEPRALAPCVPPPPCHPSHPPQPLDLVGVRGKPSCGPIYGGPCAPRTGTHDAAPFPGLHRLHDRFFDWYYLWR